MDAMPAGAHRAANHPRWNGFWMLFCGMGLLLMNGLALTAQNPLLVRGAAIIGVGAVQIIFVWWLPLPRRGRDTDSGPSVSRKVALAVQIPVSAVMICSAWLLRLDWAAPAIGMAYATAFFSIGQIVRGRPYYVAAAGWCSAGLAGVALFGAREPLAHFFVIAGAVTAGEGIWNSSITSGAADFRWTPGLNWD
jgi:hypothetical protein